MRFSYERVFKTGLMLLALVLLILAASAAYALEPNEYRQFLDLDTRKLIWFLAQIKLYFAAFVLGVPLFATDDEAGARMQRRTWRASSKT